MNNRTSKKGFTIVELVIVVAVIAILAAVLIPTFSGIIDKARMSSDQVAVRNMNTALAAEINSSKGFYEAKEAIKAAGIDADHLTPSSIGHAYLWDSANNVIVLVNEETDNVVYPEQYAGDDASDLTVYFDITIPAAIVTSNGAQTISNVVDYNKNKTEPVDLACSFTFTASDDMKSVEENDYRDWIADFVIYTDKDVTGVVLAGQYDAFDSENWLALPPSNAEANTEIPLLATMYPDETFTYGDIATFVREFNCGVVDNGTHDGALLTVELRLTNPTDSTDYKVVGVYTYTFK